MNNWLWNDHTLLTYIVRSLEFTLPQTIHICRQGIIACNNNNIRNPSLHFISWNVREEFKAINNQFQIQMTSELTELQRNTTSEMATLHTSLQSIGHCDIMYITRDNGTVSRRYINSAIYMYLFVYSYSTYKWYIQSVRNITSRWQQSNSVTKILNAPRH